VCAASGQWELNVNSSKTVKATNLKFDTLVPRDRPDTSSKNFSKRGRDQSHMTSKIFSALNANNSKTVKATNFKFGTSVHRDSPDMFPKNFSKGGVARVTCLPKIFGVKC